jgi:hypothetical protein
MERYQDFSLEELDLYKEDIPRPKYNFFSSRSTIVNSEALSKLTVKEQEDVQQIPFCALSEVKGMVILMKNTIIGILCITVFFSLFLSACSGKTNEKSSSATAKELLNGLYTVDSQTTQKFNIPVDSGFSSDSSGVYNIPEPNSIMQINQKFKNILTEKEYSAFISNNTYLNYVKACKDNGVVITPAKLQITQTSHDQNIYQFNYTASIKATFTKDNNSKTENEIGQLNVIKENNTWKVNYFSIIKSDFLKSTYVN